MVVLSTSALQTKTVLTRITPKPADNVQTFYLTFDWASQKIVCFYGLCYQVSLTHNVCEPNTLVP